MSITANRLHHARIFKAVMKEKWMDIGYKLNIQPQVAVLNRTSKHSILTFTLEFRTYHIGAADLEL